MIGFLSPDADFIECVSWGHLDKAEEICKEKYSKDFVFRQKAEDYLLSLGYLVLRARDAYMSTCNEHGEYIVLTNNQIKWLTDHVDTFNEGQKQDLNDILLNQEEIRKYKGKI